MAHKHEIPSLDETFDFSSSSKRKLVISAIIGVALVILGYFLVAKFGHHEAAHGADAHGGDHHGATVFQD